MNKRLVSIIIVFSLLFSFSPFVHADNQEINVYLNGSKMQFDVPAYKEDGRVLVPVRAIFEALGANIKWNEITQTVTATKGSKIIIIQIGNNVAKIDNVEVELDVPAKTVNWRTFVPVRFVSEALGAQVEWDGSTQSVYITDNCIDINVIMNGKKSTFKDIPDSFDNGLLLPLIDFNKMLEEIGDEQPLIWNEEEQSITITEDDTMIKMNIDSNTGYINKEAIVLDIAPLIDKDKVYIPVKFVVNRLGYELFFDELMNTYYIYTEQSFQEVKEILDKSYSVMNKIDRFKYEQSINMIIMSDENSVVQEINSNSMVDLDKNTYFENSSTTNTAGDVSSNTEMDLWIQDKRVFMRQKPFDMWQEMVFGKEENTSIVEKAFNNFGFLKSNDLLCVRLSIDEEKSDDNTWVLNGIVSLDDVSNQLENKQEIEYEQLSFMVTLAIEKDTYFLKGRKIFTVDTENVFFIFHSELTLDEINGNFELTTPNSLEDDLTTVSQAVEEIIKGNKAMDEGEFEQAVIHYDKAIESNNQAANAYWGKGIALYFLGMYEKSVDSFDLYINIYPNDTEAWILKARSLIYLNQLDMAVELCDQAITQNVKDDFAYNIMGLAQMYKGELEDALINLNLAIKIDNQYEDAYINKIATLYYLKNYSECIEFSDKALRNFPDNETIRWYKANCYINLYQYEKAVEVYKEVIKINPDSVEARVQLGWMYYTLQNYDKAFECVEKALELNKYNEDAQTLKEELEKTNLPEAQRIVDFFKNNYLYYNKIDDFSKVSEDFTANKSITISDIEAYINTMKLEEDMFTYVIGGEEYEMLTQFGETSQIAYKSMENNMEYIKIGSFVKSVGVEFEEIIKNIDDTENKTLIIDLRDNTGGLAEPSNTILDALLPECTTSFMINREGYMYTYNSDANQVKFKQIIILVNEYSASSSELLMLGLRKYLDNIVIIGHPTYGKGVGQITFENKEKKYIIFVVNHYWNVKEENIMGSKIIPDIVVEGSEDSDYFEAIESLMKK